MDEFRFNTGHITEIYRPDGTLIKRFPPVELFELSIEQIQPSQFYVSQEKLQAVSSFIHEGRDIILPVIPLPGTNRYISCDGHTRLYAAKQKGYSKVRAYRAEINEYLYGFVEEARKRGIEQIHDLKVLTQEEYIKCWYHFRDRYFAQIAEITYRELTKNDLVPELLDEFHRYQEVNKEWVEVSRGHYELVEHPNIKDWNITYKRNKVKKFRTLLEEGGRIFGAFDQEMLIGFSAIDPKMLGEQKQYIELTQLHVSNEYRGRHIGKNLFQLGVQAARNLGAEKLYIAACSAAESQEAYRHYGCVYAEKMVAEVYEDNSDLVQLEYLL